MLAEYISRELERPILYIRPHIDDADKATDDLHSFGCQRIEAFPAWEGAEDLADATDEIRAERLRVALEVLSGKSKFTIPTSIQAFCQPIPKPKILKESSLRLQINKTISPEDAAGWLVDNGFESVDRIDLPGQFARRGGIVDIYAPLVSEKKLRVKDKTKERPQGSEAIRVEFFGDTIESIREVNLDTQRSSEQIKSISIISAVCGSEDEQRELFINILPQDTIIILEEPNDIEEVANVFLERVEGAERLYNWRDIYKALEKFTQLHICRFAAGGADDVLKLDIKSVQQFQQSGTSLWAGHKAALEELVKQAKEGKKVCLFCERSAEIERVKEIIKQSHKKVPLNFKLLMGFIHQGFVINTLETIIISHHELFGQFALRRRQRPMRASAPVDTLSDLQAGDYVVHISYGVGRFLGVKTIKEKGAQNEYLTIEYADKVKIHVSASNITLVQKYIGTSPKRPKLSKVGSKKWQKQKEKVARSVRDLAGELLEVQAKRQGLGGIAFGADSNWQREFEESFPYQETSDQTAASEQIKADMQENVAMDRLLCGDVGYGKTELAMRAAFKAVESDKQVAVLVPTTVLCVQHGRTFTERFADFPICIEILNRFKTARQAQDIITRAKKGRVDILIGTHRLLSGDVGFKDLGLLVIDEEQRFGVEHKERLKKLRVNVDVLTMTATPIPRTLHMSLLGLRDISSLGTPPLDRRSIVTSVGAYNRELVRKSIIREMNRQGQVFFVHNRVRTIEKKAWEIQKLVSDAKVSIAHGQMAKSELEKTMIDFVLGEIDVLVCTTIIESGLDIPNANTIFIDNADRFGLAELHQLRGRVGRYKHRAYAYMLLPMSRSITPIAARRLKAIEEYSHLGAGFRIALRDLEIRGAGNILGAEQSGHIQIVGYQMYCELLAEAVRKLKGKPAETIPITNLDLGFATYIPKNYIPIDRHRMDVYRKIAVARTKLDLEQVQNELADVYGPVPDEVQLLLKWQQVRIAASKYNIKSIVTSGQNIVFSFDEKPDATIKSLFARVKGKVTIADRQTAYLRLEKNYFEPGTLMNVLRKLLGAAS
jgi:transcription-repair coupling factor (superfamily II helicase)